jgi:hypothetical protein
MRKATVFGISAGAVFLVWGAWSCGLTNTRLLRSSERIRASLVERLPLGLPRIEVLRYLESRGCLVWDESKAHGYMLGDYRERGKSHVSAVLGRYTLVFKTDVVAYFGFDESGRLCCLDVRKDTLAP